MNCRERYLETLRFGSPDKVPFQPGGPRESTLRNWRRQGLPEDAEWFSFLVGELGMDPDLPRDPSPDPGVDFRMRPCFDEKVIERRDGHLVVQDWKGNICEISDEFDVSYLRNAVDFVTRRWIRCPVESREDWEQMKTRYDPADPGRFPDDFEARCKEAAQRDDVLTIAFSGPFWQMREWCGFEGLCMLMLEDPGFVEEMAAFWTEFVSALLERTLAHVVFDVLSISEDMAYKGKAMISPSMIRTFCRPSWDRWCAQVHAAGVPLVDIDSDGYVGEIIPIWLESGVSVCDPMEVAAGNDLQSYREKFGHAMAFKGGVDKRCIAAGGNSIRDELRRVDPVLRDGGYIPGCDHGVPSNVTWPDFVDYSRQLAGMTGWL
jgi:uroporphyrinogen decarboxylase